MQVTCHRYRRGSAEMVHLSNLKRFTVQGQQQEQGGQQQQQQQQAQEEGEAAGALNPAAAAAARQVAAGPLAAAAAAVGQAVAGPWAAAGAAQAAHQPAIWMPQAQMLPAAGVLAPHPQQLLQPEQAQGQEEQPPMFEHLPGVFGEQQVQHQLQQQQVGGAMQDVFGTAQALGLGSCAQLSGKCLGWVAAFSLNAI